MKRTEILLVGTGAVGSYFGGKLAQGESRVTALCRSDYELVKKKGIKIQSFKGDLQFKPAEVVQNASELSASADYILICLKALPEIDLPRIIEAAVHPETAIVLIQNGIEIEKAVSDAFPNNELIGGVALIAVRRLELGMVSHTGGGKLIIGSYPTGISSKTELLAQLLKSVEVPCSTTEEIIRQRWQKMVWNAAFNPISVLGGRANSRQMVDVSESEDLVKKVMREIMSIAAASGYQLPEEVMLTALESNHKMKPFKTSMLADFESNRPMEIDAILGNAIKLAQQLRIDVPHLESIFGLLKLLETVQRENNP